MLLRNKLQIIEMKIYDRKSTLRFSLPPVFLTNYVITGIMKVQPAPIYQQIDRIRLREIHEENKARVWAKFSPT